MSGLSDRIFEQAVNAIKHKDFRRGKNYLVEFIKLEPDATDAWILRGNCCGQLGDWFDAVLHYDRALSITEELRDAWNNRGQAMANIGHWQEAARSYERSISIVDTAAPHYGLANLYHALAMLEPAEREMRAAIAIEPTAGLHFQLGLILLGQGRWKEAMQEYAYRWMDNPAPPRALNQVERWAGQDLTGKRIILCPEQGYGDEIMAYRFANKALLGAERVILQARSPLVPLARTLTGVDQVIALHDPLPEADYSCALLDVPMILDLDWKAMPRPTAYLKPPHFERVIYWTGKLDGDKCNVGVCWSSGSSYGMTAEGQAVKSFPVGMLRELKMPGVNLISLQKIVNEPIPQDLELQDWMHEVEDFGDTACLIEALDLVVSVDTAVAHVAGAIGKPVINLVRFAGFFPWLAPDVAPSPTYSIWYPSMKLFRQPRLGDWAEPITRAAAHIKEIWSPAT